MRITCFIEVIGPLWKVSPLKHNLRQWRLGAAFPVTLKEPSKKVSTGLSLILFIFTFLPDCEQEFWVLKLFLVYLTWETRNMTTSFPQTKGQTETKTTSSFCSSNDCKLKTFREAVLAETRIKFPLALARVNLIGETLQNVSFGIT